MVQADHQTSCALQYAVDRLIDEQGSCHVALDSRALPFVKASIWIGEN
jgi:hypothetical protein